jgi:hypothetical protein
VDPHNNARVLDVYDVPFPHINPRATKHDVEMLADDYFKKITTLIHEHVAEKSLQPQVPIHIMGEMSFTFALVRRLQAAGYKCLASTTRRIYSKDSEGKNVRRFEFVRFREY